MKPTRVIIHCSASKNNETVDISEIEKWHLARGFKSVGYHIVIQPDGEVQKGRALNQIGAHCEDENHDSIGICLIGNDKFTYEQLKALRYQLEGLNMVYDIPKWAIYCHHQFPSAIKQGKQCPHIPINNILCWYLTEDLKPMLPYIWENK